MFDDNTNLADIIIGALEFVSRREFNSSYRMKKVAKNERISGSDTLNIRGVSSVLNQFSPLRVNNLLISYLLLILD